MSGGRVLVAGIGNIFLGDDGFGSEVARRLAGAELPAGVRVADYGIRGLHLAYDLDGYGTAILIDAAPRGGEPGTVTVLEVEREHRRERAAAGAVFDAHGMQPDVVLSMLDMLGDQPTRVLVVCCEPASTQEGIGLNEPVAAAVGEAARIVLELVAGVATTGS